jgi:pyruvate formate lyase activating enzyme
VQACGHDAISLVGGLPVTDAERCVLCGGCLSQCPTGAREIIGQSMTIPEVTAEIEKDVIFYDESGGGATFSGGEPLMQEEFLLALLNQCRARDIHTAVDTTCYAESAVAERVAGLANLFLCDIKHMDSGQHESYTGVGNALILDNIQRLAQAGKEIFVRVPIVPGFNDSSANVEETARFAASLGTVRRVDVLPYNRGGLEKSVRLATKLSLMRAERPENDKMEEIAEVFRGHGFQVKIGG